MPAFPLRSLATALLAVALVLPLAARAEPADAEFAAKAASGGLMEVQLGAYAAENATDPEVRAFGERMVRDHEQANEKLRAAAEEAGIPLPTAMRDEHRQKLEELTGLRGEAFDRRYVELMLDDHADEVAEFTQQAEAGDSPIDRWAEQTLPTLREHLDEARKLVREEAGAGASEPSAERR